MEIKLFNSFSKQKEVFVPIDEGYVKIYVCGPTVYDRPHLGNARSVVIYDLWFRLFSKIYPHVTYVRNITDVDDKINAAAKERGITIGQLTHEVTEFFYHDMSKLNVLPPTVEPRATENIKEMIAMISKLIENGNAYESSGHVLFDVSSYGDYGKLSNRSLDEMIAGARVEVASYKKNPLDFVLWKPADENDDKSSIFESPWGKGRPGWHIECSAMSSKFLGNNFDIHGGGADLQFPHHENEIAQSVCAARGSFYAKYWVHNGFLTVDGEKMSKSLKNFITIKDLLDREVSGIVIRYLLLSTHYRKPLDYNQKSLVDASKSIEKFYLAIEGYKKNNHPQRNEYLEDILKHLGDDLNSPAAFAILHDLAKEIKHEEDVEKKKSLMDNMMGCLEFLGLYDINYMTSKEAEKDQDLGADAAYILEQIESRKKAKSEKNYQLADKIRNDLLSNFGVVLEDKPNGEVVWSKK